MMEYRVRGEGRTETSRRSTFSLFDDALLENPLAFMGDYRPGSDIAMGAKMQVEVLIEGFGVSCYYSLLHLLGHESIRQKLHRMICPVHMPNKSETSLRDEITQSKGQQGQRTIAQTPSSLK